MNDDKPVPEALSMVPVLAGRAIELSHTIPAAQLVRDRAVAAILGDLATGLHLKKDELRQAYDKMVEQNAKLGKELDAEKAKVCKEAEQDQAALLSAFRAFAAEHRLPLELSVESTSIAASSSADQKPGLKTSIELQIQRKGQHGYGSTLTFSRTAAVPKRLKELSEDLRRAHQEANDLLVQEAKVKAQIMQLPTLRVQIEAQIAKRDLMQDEASAELFKEVRKQFKANLPKDLAALL